MAKLLCTGKLGTVQVRNGGYVAFGVAEPSYKKEGTDEYITPWFNFLIKEDSSMGKFLTANKDKIDVVQVLANERETKKDNVTTYFHNVVSIEVISWKPKQDGNAANNNGQQIVSNQNFATPQQQMGGYSQNPYPQQPNGFQPSNNQVQQQQHAPEYPNQNFGAYQYPWDQR